MRTSVNMMMVMIRMRNEDEKGDVNEDRLFLGNNLMMIIFIIMVMILMMTMAMLMMMMMTILLVVVMMVIFMDMMMIMQGVPIKEERNDVSNNLLTDRRLLSKDDISGQLL